VSEGTREPDGRGDSRIAVLVRAQTESEARRRVVVYLRRIARLLPLEQSLVLRDAFSASSASLVRGALVPRV
jgi:hypothetical protein